MSSTCLGANLDCFSLVLKWILASLPSWTVVVYSVPSGRSSVTSAYIQEWDHPLWSLAKFMEQSSNKSRCTLIFSFFAARLIDPQTQTWRIQTWWVPTSSDDVNMAKIKWRVFGLNERKWFFSCRMQKRHLVRMSIARTHRVPTGSRVRTATT